MILRHKGFIAVVEPDEEDDDFFGQVINASGVITFHGRDLPELRRELATSVEVYLELCREKGLEPTRPYSGRFNLRLDPAAHAEVAAAAAVRELTRG